MNQAMRNPLRKYSYYLYSIFELLTGFDKPFQITKIFLKLSRPERQTVTLRKEGLAFAVRSPMDVWSIKETFLDRFYERFGAKIGKGWTIIDIGGGIGEFTLFAALASPENRVLVFEPFPESYALLQYNLQINQVANVQICPYAIGAESGEVFLDTSAKEPLQFSSGNEVRSAATLAVPSLSLEAVFSRFDIQTCDLLKLDCEGAEYPILLNTPLSLFRRIHRIVMEYHEIATSERQTALVKYLGQAGYRVRTQPNYVHAHLGYLYAWRPEAELPGGR